MIFSGHFKSRLEANVGIGLRVPDLNLPSGTSRDVLTRAPDASQWLLHVGS